MPRGARGLPPISPAMHGARRRWPRRAALGFADSLTADPAEAVRDADLVILCTPVGSFGELAKADRARI